MLVLQAEEELAQPVEDDERLYHLVLAATGSKERAERVLRKRVMARLRRGETPGS